MSSACRSAKRACIARRAAFSCRQTCHLPGKKVDGRSRARARRSPTASRNQRSCATRMTRGVERRELLLEPLDRGHVEVVRGLVEQQQVRMAGEGAAERGARELAARERVEAALEVGVGEAEAAQHARSRGRARRSRRRARAAPAPRRSGAGSPGAWSPVGHRLLQPAQLVLGGDEVGGARERVLAQRLAGEARRPLVVQRDARALVPGELAALELRLAHERAQQRRLAGAVRAGQRHRSRRSTLNETPSKSGSPESSLRRLEAMRTAMAVA